MDDKTDDDQVGGWVHTDKERKVHHPHVSVRAFVYGRSSNVVAQRAQHTASRAPLIGNEQQQVTSGCTKRCNERRLFCIREKLGHRRLECPAVANFHPHQALSPTLLGPIGELVEFVATHRSSLGIRGGIDAQPLDRSGRSEGLEFGGGEHRGELDELEPKPQVGLV